VNLLGPRSCQKKKVVGFFGSGQAGETGMLDENLRRWDTIDGPNCNVLGWDWIY